MIDEEDDNNDNNIYNNNYSCNNNNNYNSNYNNYTSNINDNNTTTTEQELATITATTEYNNGKQSLLQSLQENEKIRSEYLMKDGYAQMKYHQSTDGWIPTLFIISGRALDHVMVPWLFIIIHATVAIVLQKNVLTRYYENLIMMNSWEIFFSFVLNATLSLLLVFRLNRAADRFWTARLFWGDIVAYSRCYVGSIIIHSGECEYHTTITNTSTSTTATAAVTTTTPATTIEHRDDSIRWMIAYTICTMELLRRCDSSNTNSKTTALPIELFAGILNPTEVQQVEKQIHPPMYAMDQVRYHLKQMFTVHKDTPVSIAISHTHQLIQLEQHLALMIRNGGGLERIKSTPLPIVYVSHLRTFMLLSLLLYPWVFGSSWGYTTVPAVAVAAFAFLGIESAAVEVERPFKKDRVNALNMDGFILGIISTIQQQLQQQHHLHHYNHYS